MPDWPSWILKESRSKETKVTTPRSLTGRDSSAARSGPRSWTD